MSILKKLKVIDVFFIISLLLMITAIFFTTNVIASGEDCLNCDIDAGCVHLSWGMTECSATFESCILVECGLSGEMCGDYMENLNKIIIFLRK